MIKFSIFNPFLLRLVNLSLTITIQWSIFAGTCDEQTAFALMVNGTWAHNTHYLYLLNQILLLRKCNIIILLEAFVNPFPATLPAEVVEFLGKITQEHGDIADYVNESIAQCNADLAKSIEGYKESYKREFEYRTWARHSLTVPAPETLIEDNMALNRRINELNLTKTK